MKKFLLIMFVIMLTGVGVVFAQDDETALDIPVLQDRVVVNDSFGDGIFARLYAFNGTEGDIVSIGMAPTDSSELDPYLVLLGSAGQVYMTNDDAQSGTHASLIENFELPETGTYLVLATAWDTRLDQTAAEDTERDLSYVLAMSGNNVPSDSEITIIPAEVAVGSRGTLELSAEQPIFYITFVGEEGDVVTIGAESNDIDTLLYLFDRDGNRVVVNDDRASGNLASAIEGYELPADGTYLIFVTAYNFYDAYLDDVMDTGSVTFTLQ